MRVLILDDMEARRVLLAERFAHWECVIVATCAEAVAALEEAVFDLVHLDHDLGEESATGTDVARAIAALPIARRPREAVIHSHNPSGSERMRDILRDAGIPARLEPFSGLTKR